MNVRDALRHLGVRFWEHDESGLVSDGWVGVVCPRCGVGGKPGFGIHVTSLRTSCWKCSGVPLVIALAEITGRPKREIIALLGDILPERTETPTSLAKLVLPYGIGPLLPSHRKYLQGRGFDPEELVATWGIGGIGPIGAHAHRIYIPIADHTGKQVSWTTRAIGKVPHMQRYRGAAREQSLVPRGEVLCGEHLARHAVIVCEGPFDQFRIGPGAVCTCGVGFSRAQVERISRRPIRVVCFDAEEAAQRRARALANQLSCYPGETYVVRLGGSDPATAPQEDILELRARYL